MPRPKWNHAYEVAFSIETDTSPEEGVSDAELIAGLEARLAEFRANPGLAQEACGAPFDSYETAGDV